MSILCFYITCPSHEAATDLGAYLLEKKLVACFNCFPIEASFWWEGTIENSHEFVLLVKTKIALEAVVEEAVQKKHTYDLPCIVRWPIKANVEYEKWIDSVTIS